MESSDNSLPFDREDHVSQARHSSRCGICSHPERQTIEHAFLYRQASVAEICRAYGVGHDAIYRHAHALGLLEPRNRNWRNPAESDKAEVGTKQIPVESRTVPHPETEATPYARAMMKLLQIPADEEVLTAIEAAIAVNVEPRGESIQIVANDLFLDAFSAKSQEAPESWLLWFRQNEIRGSGADSTTGEIEFCGKTNSP